MEVTSEQIQQLRDRAQGYMAAHSYRSASFWADKVLALTSDARDVFAVAQAYYLSGEYERAAHILIKHDLVARNMSCRYLCARCYVELKKWSEVLEVVGTDDDDLELILSQRELNQGAGSEAKLEVSQEQDSDKLSNIESIESTLFIEHADSLIAYVRGLAHEAFDSRANAVEAYKLAVLRDPFCTEAQERITDHQLISPKEEHAFLEQVAANVPDDDANKSLLVGLYATKMSKYDDAADSAHSALPEELQQNGEVQAAFAQRLFYQAKYRECFAITTGILDNDPYHHACLPLHIACQVELKDTNGLFYLAHRLVDAYPKNELAWFAVACYYLLTKNYENARRYFSKSTQLNLNFGESWIGFGHAFAVEGEHDQAMAAYSTAARLMTASHLPLLYIGMEHAQTNNHPMALQYLQQALALCDTDANVFHELGCVYFTVCHYTQADVAFTRALELASANDMPPEQIQAMTINVGHLRIKQGDYQGAVSVFSKARHLVPNSAAAAAGLACAHHYLGEYETAVELYHQALALNPSHTFSQQMLHIALDGLATEMMEALELSASVDDSASDISGLLSLEPPPFAMHKASEDADSPERRQFESSMNASLVSVESAASAMDMSSIDGSFVSDV
eukprot:m.37138 g.37138  ORF g.37138 m.37138 type:complete len:626 (+) comp10072_c0_seq1:127-2004(+)